jgi:phosphate uptake regulator
MAPQSLADFFKADNGGDELIAPFDDLLDSAAEMFGYVVCLLAYGELDDDPQGEIYDRDTEITKLEHEIRRRIADRLCLKPSPEDVASALLFMNAVKDAKLIGDYVKNLYEVVGLMPENVDRQLYQDFLVGRSKSVEDLFGRTSQAIGQIDQDIAKEITNRAQALGDDIDATVRELAQRNLNATDAVCLTLTLHFYKGIAAHLGIVANTIVMPIERLDSNA